MVEPSQTDVRTKGQVWTPRWVADAMAVYLGPLAAESILDPAVGPGVLLSAARDEAKNLRDVIAYEIDESVISSVQSDMTFARANISDLRISDFISDEDKFTVSSVISNPPYLRHHRMSPALKARCQEIAKATLGIGIDGRAGLHIFFLIKALSHLKPGGKLSFLVPADIFEGVFSGPLWLAISRKFRIKGILTFDPLSAAFPGVDTNASVVFIENSEPIDDFTWLHWRGVAASRLSEAVRFGLAGNSSKSLSFGLEVSNVPLDQALRTGFSRLHTSEPADGTPLTAFAKMMRGVATGRNEFFLMTRKRILELELPEKAFVRTISRVRDASAPVITLDFLNELDAVGRPTYLLSLDEDTELDGTLEKYLETGVAQGIHEGSLVSMRKKWYFMEKRTAVPIVFAYLGRRKNRFIDVQTELTPLTGFLCVYPNEGVDKQRLLQALNHPASIAELGRVGKSYGDGAVKVEPGGLRKMIIPKIALDESGLSETI